jgi:hypothetical protein
MKSLNDLSSNKTDIMLKSLLMIEPCNFGFNEETAANNFFQQHKVLAGAQEQALKEFQQFVSLLRSHKIAVLTVRDTPEPTTPDSIFPNNWISFHEGAQIVLYPMFAKNRRAERKQTVMDVISQRFGINNITDLTGFEGSEKFLEGTGSMVFDRTNHLSYACISPRTDVQVLQQFCDKMNFKPVIFHAVDQQGNAIYHTNVLMCMADRYVVICLDAISDQKEKQLLIDVFSETGKTIIEISHAQMNHFCGNMLQVENTEGKKYIVMSTQAYEHLSAQQIELLQSFNPILHSNINTIETLGGGSARCMMAEVY